MTSPVTKVGLLRDALSSISPDIFSDLITELSAFPPDAQVRTDEEENGDLFLTILQ